MLPTTGSQLQAVNLVEAGLLKTTLVVLVEALLLSNVLCAKALVNNSFAVISLFHRQKEPASA